MSSHPRRLDAEHATAVAPHTHPIHLPIRTPYARPLRTLIQLIYASINEPQIIHYVIWLFRSRIVAAPLLHLPN